MNKYIEEHSIQLMQSILILVVSIVIVLGVTVLMIGNVVYMPEQFFYNITNERIDIQMTVHKVFFRMVLISISGREAIR